MELQKSQYQAIMRDYERKQLRNHDIQVERQEEVYKNIPGYRELSQSVAGLSVKQAKSLLGGNKDAVHTLHDEIEELTKKKKQLLLSYGYPEDYLDPVYDCKDCHDTGYIGNKKCHCLKQAIIEQLYKQSNIREILATENFKSFSLDLYSENFVDPKTGRTARQAVEDALKSAHHFIDTFGTEFHNVFLYGDVGVGKTFLSNCIAKEIIDKGYSVLYFSSANFFNAMADGTFQKGNPDAQYVYDQIFNSDLLVIDDLGTEYANSFVASQLFSCVNERLLNRKSTIISTNLTLDALADQYTERCFSRITSNYIMLKLIGDDLRIKKKLIRR